MVNPVWFEKRYPSLADLEEMAEAAGAGIGEADIPMGVFIADVLGVPVILLPKESAGLNRIWTLAHELGHLVLHSGPRGVFLYGKDEAAADRWAARALIPERVIRHYGNASLDVFIGALSKHYEDIPLMDCPQRRLAAHIGSIRLRAIEEVA
jgi:Zn-dependent peptidase ImmA (M78 family)